MTLPSREFAAVKQMQDSWLFVCVLKLKFILRFSYDVDNLKDKRQVTTLEDKMEDSYMDPRFTFICSVVSLLMLPYTYNRQIVADTFIPLDNRVQWTL